MLWFQINRVIVREAEQLETFASVFLAGNIQQKKKKVCYVLILMYCGKPALDLVFAHIQRQHLLI